MSHNHPQHPQHSQAQPPQEPDPAGSTQMFQAFVNGDSPRGGPRAATPAGPASASRSGSGPRVGLILGVVVAVAALAAVAWLALG
jgi:hypothetical protein